MRLTRAIKNDLGMLMRAYPYAPAEFAYIRHPLVSSQFVAKYSYDGMRVDGFEQVTSENWDAILNRHIEHLWRLKTVEQVFYLALNKPYKLDVLYYIMHRLDIKTYSAILGNIWVEVEFPHQLGVRRLIAMFKRSDAYSMMEKEERVTFDEMQVIDELPLYRGIRDNRSAIRGLSWTTDHSKAHWFAARFCGNNPRIITATCKPKHRFAYFQQRGEDEVVVNPAGLKIISVEKIGEQT